MSIGDQLSKKGKDAIEELMQVPVDGTAIMSATQDASHRRVARRRMVVACALAVGLLTTATLALASHDSANRIAGATATADEQTVPPSDTHNHVTTVERGPTTAPSIGPTSPLVEQVGPRPTQPPVAPVVAEPPLATGPADDASCTLDMLRTTHGTNNVAWGGVALGVVKRILCRDDIAIVVLDMSGATALSLFEGLQSPRYNTYQIVKRADGTPEPSACAQVASFPAWSYSYFPDECFENGAPITHPTIPPVGWQDCTIDSLLTAFPTWDDSPWHQNVRFERLQCRDGLAAVLVLIGGGWTELNVFVDPTVANPPFSGIYAGVLLTGPDGLPASPDPCLSISAFPAWIRSYFPSSCFVVSTTVPSTATIPDTTSTTATETPTT